MSYAKLVLDFYDVLSAESSGDGTVDMQNHANGFADAVDSYVKELKDPGDRKLKSTTKSLMVPPIVAVAAAPGTGNADADATKSALQYATAVQLYTLAAVVDNSGVNLNLGGILTPPGNPTVATIATTSLLPNLQSDLKSIFTEETPEGVPLAVLTLQKATKFADAIKSAFTTGTSVTISGTDSSLPPPAGPGPQPFSIVGPLKES